MLNQLSTFILTEKIMPPVSHLAFQPQAGNGPGTRAGRGAIKAMLGASRTNLWDRVLRAVIASFSYKAWFG
jgi:hypothetical protein